MIADDTGQPVLMGKLAELPCRIVGCFAKNDGRQLPDPVIDVDIDDPVPFKQVGDLFTMHALEDLYRNFKEKKRTRAGIALAQGAGASV